MSDYYVVESESLTDVADAIREKTGGSSPLEFPDDFVSEIGSISGGGSRESIAPKDVNFIDYDGTLLYSYTTAEINTLTELPANPTHTGLVAQGWNWTLVQIKAQLTAMPNQAVWVGQMYITQSGDTEIDVRFPNNARLSPILTIAVDGTVTVDWGDNTALDTVTGTSLTTRQEVLHTYADAGNYTIIIHVVSGNFTFYGNTSENANYTLLRKNTTANENYVYASTIHAIRLGSGITQIGTRGLAYCGSLTHITIPNTVTSIGTFTFYNCYSLASITIPNSVTSIGTYIFYICSSLASVSMPNSVTSIDTYAFYSCYSLVSVAIPNSVTSIGSYAFYACYSLTSVVIPNSVVSLDTNTFYNCYSLASVTIPNSVTSLGASLFLVNRSLTSITLPNSLTSIGSSAFSGCYGMKEYHFQTTTPPTIKNSNVFLNIVSDCIIYVPYSADHSVLNTYKTTTNWSTHASKIQEEPT